jgi:hypothetical protein
MFLPNTKNTMNLQRRFETREATPQRPTENLIYMFLEKHIAQAVSEVSRRICEFRYTGPFVDENNAHRTVTNAKVTRPKNVILCRQDGTEERAVQDRVEKEYALGGGGYFLLDRYVHCLRPSHPRLFETTGLTSDLDYAMYLCLYDETSGKAIAFSESETSPSFERAVKAFAIQVLNEYFARDDVRHALDHIFQVLSAFVKFKQHSLEHDFGIVTNLDGGRGILYALDWQSGDEDVDASRININVEFELDDEVHIHHLCDLFLYRSMYTRPVDTVMYEPYPGIFISAKYNSFLIQLGSMYNRYIDAWLVQSGGGGRQEAVPFVRCSNDRRRFLWLLMTMPVLPESMFNVSEERKTVNTGNFIWDTVHFYRAPITSRVIRFVLEAVTSEKIPVASIFEMTDADVMNLVKRKSGLPPDAPVIIKYKTPEDTLAQTIISEQVIRVCRLAVGIQSVMQGFYWDGAFKTATNAQKCEMVRTKLEELFDRIDSLHPHTPCNIHETPEYAQEVVRAYNETIAFVDQNAYSGDAHRRGEAAAFGRFFAKRVATRLRSRVFS